MATRLRVLGFTRISRDTEMSSSIDKQREAVENFCRAMGWDLVHTASSFSVSGNTAPRDHESLSEWLSDTPPKTWDVFLSNTLDRVSRNTRDTLELVKWLDERGKSLRTIVDNVDSGSGAGKLMLTILSAVAEAERTFTMERLAATRKHLRRGGWHQQGTAPYGYRAEQAARGDGKLGWRWVPDEKAKDVLDGVISRAIEGASVSEICSELDRDSVPPPSRGGRQGDSWSPASLHRILKGEQLLGHGYHKGEVIREHGRPVPFGPPLIDRARYDRLQLALSDHGKPHAKNHARSLLYGMITCTECGTGMVGSGQGARESYVCRNPRCHNGSVLRRIAHEVVEGAVPRGTLGNLSFVPGAWTTTQSVGALEGEMSELLAASKQLTDDRQAGDYEGPEMTEIYRTHLAANRTRMTEVRELLASTPADGTRVFEPTGPLTRWLDAWNTTEDEGERRELLAIAGIEVLAAPPVPGGSPADRVRVISPQLRFSLSSIQLSSPLRGIAILDRPTSVRGAPAMDFGDQSLAESMESGDLGKLSPMLEEIRAEKLKSEIRDTLNRWLKANPGMAEHMSHSRPGDPGYADLMREIRESAFPELDSPTAPSSGRAEPVGMLGTDHGLKGTDWSLYAGCPECLVDAGQLCRSLVARKGEGGLGHQGMRPLRRPHKGRPKV